MAIYNREDPRTALPQLEKQLSEATTYRKVNISLHQCNVGNNNCCYKIGSLVLLAININVTTATNAYAYLTGLPRPLQKIGGCAVSNSSTLRFHVSTNGELISENTPSTGWHNGFVAYIAKE